MAGIVPTYWIYFHKTLNTYLFKRKNYHFKHIVGTYASRYLNKTIRNKHFGNLKVKTIQPFFYRFILYSFKNLKQLSVLNNDLILRYRALVILIIFIEYRWLWMVLNVITFKVVNTALELNNITIPITSIYAFYLC